MKLSRQVYTVEFKEEAVKRVKSGERITSVVKALGLGDRNWLKASAEGTLQGSGCKIITPEEMELSRLRAENGRLKREVDILKKATAYFARDTL